MIFRIIVRAGVDSDMTMKLTSFWFFCNRPTVAALIGVGTDMAAATDVPEAVAAADSKANPSTRAAIEKPEQVICEAGQLLLICARP